MKTIRNISRAQEVVDAVFGFMSIFQLSCPRRLAMSTKPTQPEEIDLLLKQMEECDLQNEAPCSASRVSKEIVHDNFRGASTSPYRDAYIKTHNPNN